MIRSPRIRSHSSSLCLLVLIASLAAFGCGGGKVSPPIDANGLPGGASVVDSAPESSSPEAAVQYIAWALNRRDGRRYLEILTEDFQFALAATDSAGNAYRDRSLTREDEAIIARNMFETGTPTLPPINRLVMTLGRSLVTSPDPRPGKDPRVHQVVRANLVISAETGDQSFRISGAGVFYMVRGDSARIPPELAARGFRPDQSRWWVERWEDETLSSPSLTGKAAMPTRSVTWGAVKVLYH